MGFLLVAKISGDKMRNITVVSNFSISPSNWDIGDILKGTDGEQYTPIDHIKENVYLQKLTKEERIKAEFLQGTVQIS